MACCIAIALLIGLVRSAYLKVFPSRAPAETAFAPPARRGGRVPIDSPRPRPSQRSQATQ
jgi:hypothetical protein